MANEVAGPLLIAMIMQIIEEEEAEYEDVRIALAQIGALELLELEDGVGLEDIIGRHWVAVTVVINDYHILGDPCFKLHFRMSRNVFERLVAVVDNHLVQTGRLRRRRTPLQDIMLMVVWLLATPDSFRSVALRFGVNPGTLYYFYVYIIEALQELAATYITWPTVDERRNIKATFERATGFPGIIGCIDCTHINITAPIANPNEYINRHHSYSMNVQAVVDHTLLVRDLYVGEVGSMNDSRVFRRSPLHHDLLQDANLRQIIAPDEHLVGDGAYTVTDFMMVPFPRHPHMPELQRNFNRRLSQCRVRVENAFAREKGKWRRTKYLHARIPRNVVQHITASFVLHNFVILEGEGDFNEEDLARRLPNNNQQADANVGGGDGGDDGSDDGEAEQDPDEGLLEAAEARGQEKLDQLMRNLPPLDED